MIVESYMRHMPKSLHDHEPGVAPAATDSGIPVAVVYTAQDLPGGEPALARRSACPASRRTPAARTRRCTASGCGRCASTPGSAPPEHTNERFRYLLAQGQTALSVAFDLPTQLGYDSCDPSWPAAEVGRVGVAIDTADDMAAVFDGLPLDEVSVNFTINATAPIILAVYLVAAERLGRALAGLTGTLQNDILKEFLARKPYRYPPGPSLRLVTDVVEFSSRELPRFNPISVTGYHAREAGCDAVQELALTMSSAIAYCEAFGARGLAFDTFAPRLSFHFSSHPGPVRGGGQAAGGAADSGTRSPPSGSAPPSPSRRGCGSSPGTRARRSPPSSR